MQLTQRKSKKEPKANTISYFFKIYQSQNSFHKGIHVKLATDQAETYAENTALYLE